MAGIFQRLSLLLIVLALAFAPLRGSLAQTPVSATPGDHHCAQMAHAKHAPGTAADASLAETGSGHDCTHGCKGNCCGSACGCAHVAAAIPAAAWSVPSLRVEARPIPPLSDFTQNTLSPPFRPPVSAAG